MPLVQWSPRCPWTLGHALEGTLILGATGSGKSSTSGWLLAMAMLQAGFGGLVLTAKADEARICASYCAAAGRSTDLMLFGPGTDLKFNFLDYELNRPGDGGGHTENIVNLFSSVLEIGDRRSGAGGGRDSEGYWRHALRQLLRNSVDLVTLATGRVSVPDLYRVVVSAAQSSEEAASDGWKRTSFCFQCLTAADQRGKSARQEHDFRMVADYFLLELPRLSDKTRSVITSSFTSMADLLNRGILREHFCTDTTVTPEMTEAGKIILMNFPVKEFLDVGQFAQVLFKNAWQRAIERRDARQSPRPVFLFVDEAQNLVTSYDMMFQTTCRSARVATVLISQNLSNFYAALGPGEKGRAEADSLFANLNTRIFHANADPVTNNWAASIAGRTRQYFYSGNSAEGDGNWVGAAAGFGSTSRSSAGFSEHMEFEIDPGEFTRFRTGGAAHRGYVDAILMQNGRVFEQTGRSWLPITLRQPQWK